MGAGSRWAISWRWRGSGTSDYRAENLRHLSKLLESYHVSGSAGAVRENPS